MLVIKIVQRYIDFPIPVKKDTLKKVNINVDF